MVVLFGCSFLLCSLIIIIMSSLPVLPVLSKKGPGVSHNGGHSFLKINSMPQRTVRKSLERQAIESLHNKHYIYIDFQMNSKTVCR